jgi:class 3 adenylate cyclase
MDMVDDRYEKERYFRELGLFLQEICCHLCRFQHVSEHDLNPWDVKINREVYLGIPGTYADIRVQVPGSPPYFVEVKYAREPNIIIGSIKHKYGNDSSALDGASKLILVVDTQRHKDWPKIQKEIESNMQGGLKLEVWDESHLISLIRASFDLDFDNLSEENVPLLKEALDKDRGLIAFGKEWNNDNLQTTLLWHFGSWQLKRLRQNYGYLTTEIIPPGLYKNVVVIMADICSFASYVKDTRDDEVVRYALTSYYSKAGYEIRNTGGMLYQFVGDEVSAFYGIRDSDNGFMLSAFETAKAILDIGNWVSYQWQRNLDHVQQSKGVHIGMALGDVQIVSLRPFGRALLSAFGDTMNLTARLVDVAGPSKIVISNTYYQNLDQKTQAEFKELEPIEAKNIGTIKAWQYSLE